MASFLGSLPAARGLGVGSGPGPATHALSLAVLWRRDLWPAGQLALVLAATTLTLCARWPIRPWGTAPPPTSQGFRRAGADHLTHPPAWFTCA